MARPNDGRLDSWKEIAEYLRRDERTVRRWEATRSLPVHRVPGKGRRAVYAQKSEIDAWLQKGGAVSTPDEPAPLNLPTSISEPTPKSSWASRLGGYRVVAASVCLIVLVLAVFAIRSRGDVEIGSVTFSGMELLAWSNGKVAWSYNFGQPLRALNAFYFDGKIQIVDLKGDGHKVIVVGVPLIRFENGTSSTDAIYCFSMDGKVLWRHSFDERIHFGGEDAGPRWELFHIAVTHESGRPTIWATLCSFPTSVGILYKIDANGNPTKYFVNYGHLRPINSVRTPEGEFLLTAGVNNETSEGILAVLSETEPSGRSPQTGSLADCDSCPSGQPIRYFAFPRSEVDQVIGPAYNTGFNILVTNSRIQVMTLEGPNAQDEYPPADWAMYDISAAFAPQSVMFSDNYWTAHERLSEEGRINHPVDKCPERLESITVREWGAQDGWTNVSLPPLESARR
jgi:hypothetical protein